MTARELAEIILLTVVVLGAWVGVLGMLRMREPTQALHYLALPASVSGVALTIAVFVHIGSSQAGWKTLAIYLVILAINSVVTHASARAFRARKLGHWQPREGDPMEFVADSREEQS